jgi:hypothetical protein
VSKAQAGRRPPENARVKAWARTKAVSVAGARAAGLTDDGAVVGHQLGGDGLAVEALLQDVEGLYPAVQQHQKLAEIHPPSENGPRRAPGTLRGRIRLASDFDTLPDDTLAAMHGETE